jgi:hypothetical protein
MVLGSKVGEKSYDAGFHETMALRVPGSQGSRVLVLSEISITGYDLLAKYTLSSSNPRPLELYS